MRAQRGFGLVEMMVATTIGLFLILGLGAVFFSMRQTSIARQGLSDLQNSERMAMTFLGAGIQGAGFYPAFPFGSASPPPSPITGTGNGVGYGVASPVGTDTLSVSFVTPLSGTPGAVIQGCSPSLTPSTPPLPYTDIFSIKPSVSVPGVSDLVCNENNGPDIHLVAGVQGMSVLYGVDTTNSGSVTSYLPASSVTATQWIANNPRVIRTVSITLQFTNPLAGQTGQPATVSFTRTIPYLNGL